MNGFLNYCFNKIIKLLIISLYFQTPFHREAAKSGICIAITLLYVKLESPTLAPQRFGYILTVLNLSTIIYPLTGVVSIIFLFYKL